MVRTSGRNPIGVILAGGASRRMGIDKATVELAGRPMLEWVGAALRAVTDRIVVAGPERPGLTDEMEVIDDAGRPHRGPLAGVASVLRSADPGDVVVVVGVDQPWVRRGTIEAIVARVVDRAVVPVPDGIRQTTCAAYPADLSEIASAELDAGGSLQSMLDRAAFDPVPDTELAAIGEDGRSWFSVDTAEDLARGIDRYGPPAAR